MGTADATGEAGDSQQRPDRQSAHRDDQPRPQELHLPVSPERAQLPLPWRRRTIASSGWHASWIAARHRGAVEGGVELVLVQLQPAPQRLARTPPPGPALLTLDDAGGLAVEVRALVEVLIEHGERLE